ncbi:cupin domain-containing protein [Granulicella sp. dw_53]|uniref:cupin domain-containing protein n=1 Tax=Granulicella sp. dw_53 TaxID=2719792 RepID=UPI001BD4DBB6|nr:cupin domain-containing protein [Granulicella sp. dw_53]
MKQGQAAPPKGYLRASTVESSLAYLGSVISLLAKGTDTDGRFAFIEFQTKPGNEPPPHVHEWEHELYYVLEGVMELYVEDKVFSAGPGESVFLPAGKAHTFYVRSPRLRTLMLFVAAGEHEVVSDSYFMRMGEPAKSMELQEDAITYQTDDPSHGIRVGAELGVHLLTPEEAKRALPHYPGFGAHLKELASQ